MNSLRTTPRTLSATIGGTQDNSGAPRHRFPTGSGESRTMRFKGSECQSSGPCSVVYNESWSRGARHTNPPQGLRRSRNAGRSREHPVRIMGRGTRFAAFSLIHMNETTMMLDEFAVIFCLFGRGKVAKHVLKPLELGVQVCTRHALGTLKSLRDYPVLFPSSSLPRDSVVHEPCALQHQLFDLGLPGPSPN